MPGPPPIKTFRVVRFVNRNDSIDFEASVLQSAIVQAMMNVYAELASGATIQVQVRHFRQDDRPGNPRGRVQLVIDLALQDVSSVTSSMFREPTDAPTAPFPPP